MADRHYKIPEIVVEGKRLGRHVDHDPRSLQYQVAPTRTIASVEWKREIPILDQGNLGSCVGNAATGALGTPPYHEEAAVAPLALDEKYAVQLYSDATQVDDDPQNYPPIDTGSSGLAAAKVLKARGLISGYLHATSVEAAKTAIQSGPILIGSNWYAGFDNPDVNGLVKISGQVRGGHEYEAVGYDADKDLWTLANSWGPSFGIDGYFHYSSATLSRLLFEQGDVTSFVPASQPAPTPTPTPTPSNIDVILWNAVKGWTLGKHYTAATKAVAAALKAWAAGHGLN